MIAQPEAYGVYVLKCQTPESIATVENRALQRVGYVPNYVYRAFNCWDRYYVGYAGDVRDRLYQHIEGSTEAANFTFIFHPRSIHNISWHEDKATAKREEESTAIRLRNALENAFVYQN